MAHEKKKSEENKRTLLLKNHLLMSSPTSLFLTLLQRMWPYVQRFVLRRISDTVSDRVFDALENSPAAMSILASAQPSGDSVGSAFQHFDFVANPSSSTDQETLEVRQLYELLEACLRGDGAVFDSEEGRSFVHPDKGVAMVKEGGCYFLTLVDFQTAASATQFRLRVWEQ